MTKPTIPITAASWNVAQMRSVSDAFVRLRFLEECRFNLERLRQIQEQMQAQYDRGELHDYERVVLVGKPN